MKETLNTLLHRMTGPRIGLSGHFTLKVTGPDGSPRVVADFSNMVLNQGFDYLLSNTSQSADRIPWSRAWVGSSSLPESPEQRGLQAPFASQYAGPASSSKFDEVKLTTEPAYVIRCTTTIRFPAGSAAGNVAEVGVGWGNSATDLFCRARVRDALGNPTTVQVASDEFLDVTYVLSIHLDTEDKIFVLNLPSGSHEVRMRPSALGSLTSDFLTYGAWLHQARNGGTPDSLTHTSEGVLGPLTGSITGSRQSATVSVTPRELVPGTAEREFDLVLGLTSGNYPSGLKALNVGFQFWMGYQFQFTPAIPKTGDKLLTLRIRVSFGRR